MRRFLVPLTAALLLAACTSAPSEPAPQPTPLEAWLAATPVQIAHRGGSADWPECTALAYREAAALSPDLALEVPVWRSADGVWVVSHDPSTAREFGVDLDIRTTPWEALAQLRTLDGAQPMARLVEDVLAVHGDRVLFVDDKADQHVQDLLDVLDSHGGPDRYVLKSFATSSAVPEEGNRRGYTTWGYYYPDDMQRFAETEGRYDLLGMSWDAPAATWTTMLGTGKPVIAHIVSSAEQARAGLDAGASGLMVSGVRAVVTPGGGSR